MKKLTEKGMLSLIRNTGNDGYIDEGAYAMSTLLVERQWNKYRSHHKELGGGLTLILDDEIVPYFYGVYFPKKEELHGYSSIHDESYDYRLLDPTNVEEMTKLLDLISYFKENIDNGSEYMIKVRNNADEGLVFSLCSDAAIIAFRHFDYGSIEYGVYDMGIITTIIDAFYFSLQYLAGEYVMSRRRYFNTLGGDVLKDKTSRYYKAGKRFEKETEDLMCSLKKCERVINCEAKK